MPLESIPKVFVDQQDDESSTAGRALKCARHGAHGFFAGGLVAFARPCAGGIKPQSARIGGTGDGFDAPYGVLHAAGNELVPADDQADGFRPEGHRADAVARTVDLYDNAVFRERIGRGEIKIRMHGAREQRRTIRGRGFPVPEDFVPLFAQAVGEAKRLDGHAAADGDHRTGRGFCKDKRRGYLSGIKDMGLKAARSERGSGFFKLFNHGKASFGEVDIGIIP